MKNLSKKNIVLTIIIFIIALSSLGSWRYAQVFIEENEQIKEELLEIKSINGDLEKKVAVIKDKNKDLSEKNKLEKEKAEKLRKQNESLKQNNTTRGSNSKRKVASNGKFETYEATHYCACKKCCGPNAKGMTRTGTKVKEGRTIAVDPNVIPLGSKVEIKGYGTFIAEDTGSAIKGKIVDIYVGSHDRAKNLGRKEVEVRIVE